VENAYESLAQLLRMYDEMSQVKDGIEEPVFIHPSAKIGKSVYIGAFSYIGENTVIEDNCKVYPHCHIGNQTIVGSDTKLFSGVKIYKNSVIGKSCTIHSGAVIGSDGFGFAPNKENEYQKVPQIGNVIIHDFVEIGANTTIDRATIGSTVIGKGVKLDNLVQVAHNVEIEANCVVAAQSGIAGSTKIGEDVMMGGQVGIIGHLKIAKGTKIAAQSGVAKDVLKENTILQGSPSFSIGDYKRSYVLFKNLPNIRQQILDINKKINNNNA
jgi:UDP-3-O-[3-hydroxymyristoyl] glucosamine N-acyltransferase